MFSRLRRSLALTICPALAPAPPRRFDTKEEAMAAVNAPSMTFEEAAAYSSNLGFFDVEEAHTHSKAQLEFIAAIRVGARVGSAAQASAQDQSSEPKPWEDLKSREDVQAWLSVASEEELGAMAERLLGDGPLTEAEAAVRALVASAVCASEGLSRRVMKAMQPASGGQYRWQPRGSDEGGRA